MKVNKDAWELLQAIEDGTIGENESREGLADLLESYILENDMYHATIKLMREEIGHALNKNKNEGTRMFYLQNAIRFADEALSIREAINDEDCSQ